MSVDKTFPPVGPDSVLPVAISYAAFLGPGVAIASVKSISLAVHRGTDATPADRLYNAAQIDGQRIVQWIRYPVLDVVYKLKAVIIAADGREWPCTAYLPCREL